MFNKMKSSVRLFAVGVLALGSVMLQPTQLVDLANTARAEGPQVAQEAAAVPESNPYADLSQCTAGAWQFAAEAGHKLPWFQGNATDWRQGALDAGLQVTDELKDSVVNSVAVWHAYVGGTQSPGHVGWVTAVRDGEFQVRERNWDGPGVDGTRWVKWEPGISFITFGAQPSDLQVTAAPSLSEENPEVEQPVHVRFTVKNMGTMPITLRELVAGVRHGASFEGDPVDLPPVRDLTLQPGEEYTYDEAQTFAESGEYTVQPMLEMEGYGWTAVTDSNGQPARLTFEVKEPSVLSLAGVQQVIGNTGEWPAITALSESPLGDALR